VSQRWEEREPDLRGVFDEIRRLFRRARQRKLLVLAITVGLVALIGVREARKQRTYPARVILTATEGERALDGAAHTNAKLADYIWYAVFTDRALLPLMQKYDFRPDLFAKKNDRLALDDFREDLDVDIFKNEFAQPRFAGGPPRSARISISMRMPDPEVALALTRDLAELVIKRDAENRRERIEVEQKLATNSASLADTDLQRLQRSLSQARVDLEVAPPEERGTLFVKIADLEGAVIRAQAELRDADMKKHALESEKRADKESLTLRFDFADLGAPERKVDRWLMLARTLGLAFFGLLPLVAMGVGAFDRRVYDERDVARAGLKAWGVVRRTKEAS
jgi:hypothetical protein